MDYYVELTLKNDNEPYLMQSKWFVNIKLAKDWFYSSWDFINENKIEARIMGAKWHNGCYGDIVFIEKISLSQKTR